MDENSLFTPFDEITQTRELQMLKTIIPYIPHDSQKQMTLMVHYISLMDRNPIALEKGHGLYAEGPEGQKYLDFTSGIGVNSLGYCDLTWAEAVSEQAHKLQHTSNPVSYTHLHYWNLRQMSCWK